MKEYFEIINLLNISMKIFFLRYLDKNIFYSFLIVENILLIFI